MSTLSNVKEEQNEKQNILSSGGLRGFKVTRHETKGHVEWSVAAEGERMYKLLYTQNTYGMGGWPVADAVESHGANGDAECDGTRKGRRSLLFDAQHTPITTPHPTPHVSQHKVYLFPLGEDTRAAMHTHALHTKLRTQHACCRMNLYTTHPRLSRSCIVHMASPLHA
jgi:hypothetical protein